MDYQIYCEKLGERFLKSEYISIAQSSFKMLFAPKKAIAGMRVYCFIVSSEKPSESLCKAMGQYALSAAFYDEKNEHLKTAVLPLFVGDGNFSQELKAFKESGAYILPCAYDLTQNKLFCPRKFPLLGSGQFKEISEFATSVLNP